MVSDFTACKIVVSVFLPAANGRGVGDAHPRNGNFPKLHYMMDAIVCVYDRLKWTWLQLKHMDTVNTFWQSIKWKVGFITSYYMNISLFTEKSNEEYETYIILCERVNM